MEKLRGLDASQTKPEHREDKRLDSSVHQAIGGRHFVPFSPTDNTSTRWLQTISDLKLQRRNKFSEALGVHYVEGAQSLVPHIHHSDFLSLPSYSSDFKRNVILRVAGEGNVTMENNKCLKFSDALIAKVSDSTVKCLPGPTLISPAKVQLEKCRRCSLEFCSTINYKRHLRLHQRSFKIDKVSRELLGSFWDKLPINEQKDLLSYKNVELQGVSRSSITNMLTTMIMKHGFTSLPDVYVKAGSSLLELALANHSRIFPITSQELFSILDDASEKTFLCAGTCASSRPVFMDGELDKAMLETKNVISCLTFILEEKLVKAWLADKNAEALKRQESLLEEEAISKR